MPYALITGGGARIGQALALHMAKRGYAITLHYYRGTAAAEDTAQRIRKAGAPVTLVQADLSNREGVEMLVQALTPEPPNVLILNASLFQRDAALTVRYDTWLAQQTIHGYASLALMQRMHAAPAGNVITLLDHQSHQPQVDFCSYALGKSQLRQLTLTMAKALAPRVRVNGIALGYALPATTQRPEHFDALVAATPLARPVTIAEISATLDFILDTPSLTGQILTLDGGASL